MNKGSKLPRLLPGRGLLLLYAGLGILYIFLLVFLGLRTFQNKHLVLFVLGFVIPLLWIVGAILPPKGMSRVDAQYARRDDAG